MSQNYLGLSLHGITVFKHLFNTVNKEEKALFYTWNQIEKLSIEKKKVCIHLRDTSSKPVFNQPRQAKSSQPRSGNRVLINVNSEKKAKSILNLSQSLLRHHDAIQQRQTSKIPNFQASVLPSMTETFSNDEYGKTLRFLRISLFYYQR